MNFLWFVVWHLCHLLGLRCLKRRVLIPHHAKRFIELRTPELTARWEAELERIARGQGKPGPFLEGIRSMAKELVSTVKGSKAEYKPHNVSSSHCPDCNARLLEKKGNAASFSYVPRRIVAIVARQRRGYPTVVVRSVTRRWK